jgi:hypothetical protein
MRMCNAKPILSEDMWRGGSGKEIRPERNHAMESLRARESK